MVDSSSGTNGPFSIETLDQGNDVRMVVEGELDLATAPELTTALGHNDHRSITLDLGRLTFMDASSLRIIIDAQRRAVAQGRVVNVESCRGIVARVFAMTGQDARLGSAHRRTEAHASRE